MGDICKDTTGSNPIFALGPNTSLTIHRRLYTQELVDKEYGGPTASPSFKDRFRSACACSFSRVLRVFLSYFPVISVIRNYSWKKDAANDFISGLSVAFLNMPQGLAQGMLASVPPVFGLYSTFYPSLIYIIFGTSRHISIGTNALISLITAGIVDRELEAYMARYIEGQPAAVTSEPEILNGISNPVTSAETLRTLSAEQQMTYKIGVAMAVTLTTGAILVCMGFLKLGFVTSYMSTSFIGGFTTAAAFHIVASQTPKILNIKVPSHRGAGKIIRTYIDIFKNIKNSNVADIVTFVISLVFLLTITILVNERYRSKLRVPIPLDLIIVVVSTLISHLVNLEDKYGVAVVGNIPLGLPAPFMPDTGVIGRIFLDSFILAMVIFTLTIALAKLMASLHNYPIDNNQELIAYGMCNFIGSFFLCVPTCTAPPRTMILSNIGSRSTLNGIVSALFLLLTILAAGQLFVSLPVAVLAAMICVAIKNLLLQVKQLPDLWRISKPDFWIWLITCTASTLIDLDIGIVVGVGLSIFTVIVRNQLASGIVGGLSKKEDRVLFGRNGESIKENEKFRIFYFPSQLFFANAERFSNEIFTKALNPLYIDPSYEQTIGVDHNDDSEASKKELDNGKPDEGVKFVILECSAMTYIDVSGANELKKIANQYQKMGVTLLLANCPAYSLDLLNRAGYFKIMDRNTVFCDVYDAVTCIRLALV